MSSKADPSPTRNPSSSEASTSTVIPAPHHNAPPTVASPTQPTPETTPPDAQSSATQTPPYFPEGPPKSRTPQPQGVILPSSPMYRGPNSASSDQPSSSVPQLGGPGSASFELP